MGAAGISYKTVRKLFIEICNFRKKKTVAIWDV